MTSNPPVPDPDNPGKLLHLANSLTISKTLMNTPSTWRYEEKSQRLERPIVIFSFALTKFYQINAHMAMMALRIGAPKDYMQLLEKHADIVNLPRVGVDEMLCFQPCKQMLPLLWL